MDILRGGWAPGLLGNGAGLRADSPSTGDGTYSSEAQAIFAAFTTPPTFSRKALIDACVVSLKSGGVWAKLDCLYAFAAADSQAAKINWVQPGTYNATEVNAPTFTANQGFTGAATKSLDTGFNGSSAAGRKFTQNDASVFAWSLDNIDTNGALVGGAAVVAGETILFPRSTNQYYWYVNNATGSAFANTDSIGLWLDTRVSSAAVNIYRNGAAWNAAGSTSQSPANQNMLFLNRGGAGPWTGRIAWGGIGSQLSAGEALALYNALNTYQTGLPGTTYQSESETIFASFTTPPTTARAALIDAAVASLKTAGVWAKLDALYMLAAADSQAALINWKQPGTYNATLVNAPTFTVDRGFTGASTKYIDSNFNPTTAGSPKFVQNSANAFAWSVGNVSVIGGMVGHGSVAASATTVLYPRHPTGAAFYARTNHVTTNLTAASTDSTGFWDVNRSAASASQLYKNGASVGSDATVSVAPLNANIEFLRAGAEYWTGQAAAGGFGQSLDSTEQTALYNALNTYLAGVGAVASYQAETNAIAAAFTTPPTTARKNLIDACVVSLKSAGVWAKLDALYAFAAADSQAAKINWKAPGTFNATEVNAPAFVADRGFTGNGTTSYLDSTFNPSTATTPNYVQNSADAFAWCLTETNASNGIMGSPSTLTTINPRFSGSFYGRINMASAANVTGASATAIGLWSVVRTNATATEMYKNGATAGTFAFGSALTNEVFWFLKSGVSYDATQVAAGGFSSQLNSTEQTALYNALRTYMTGVGVP